MQVLETWSISHERITAFFLAQEDVCPEGDNCYSFGSCEIRLTVLPERMLGGFRFPQTQVAFSGPEAETEAIHRRFMLQFISAGA